MTAARIRELVNSLRLTSASAEPIRVTVSIGIAMSPIAGMTSEADLFHAADRALYDAKRGGKDRINTATVSAAGGGQTDDVGRAVRQSNRAAAENPSLER